MRKCLLTLLLSLFVLSLNLQAQANTNSDNTTKEVAHFHRLTGLSDHVLKLAFSAYECAVLHGYHHRNDLLTIVDYKMPDYRKRLWVLDLKTKKVLFWTYVAHGSGSGNIYATRFSNVPNTFESSLGLYETGRSYDGEWGYSMRLHGLVKGFNSNAFKRDIVMHSGSYVGSKPVHIYGRIGLSHGCMVIPVKYDHTIINTLRGGSLIFAYYPEKSWLRDSYFLHCPIKRRS